MPNARYSLGRYKTSNVKVKKSRRQRTTIRPFGYLANTRWRIIELVQHVEYSEDILLLRDVVLTLAVLFGSCWALYWLFPGID